MLFKLKLLNTMLHLHFNLLVIRVRSFKFFNLDLTKFQQVFVTTKLLFCFVKLFPLRFKFLNQLLSIVKFVLNTLNMKFQLLLYFNVVSYFSFVLLQLSFIKSLQFRIFLAVKLCWGADTNQVVVATVIEFRGFCCSWILFLFIHFHIH